MNGPALWDKLLSVVDVDGAVIAGGCIRDYMLRLEPKDYDIFVPVTSRDALEALVDRLSTVGDLTMLEPGEHANPPGRRYAEYDDAFGEGGMLHGVAEGELLGVPVNIIARTAHADGPDALIRSFDFCVLQAYYSGEGIEATPGMVRDIHQKRATLAHEKHKEQSIARFERFNYRNPGVLSYRNPFGIDVV